MGAPQTMVSAGAGRGGCDGDCKMRSPLMTQELLGAAFLFIVSLACFAMCMDGINKVPKCRYGEKNCYFAREIRDHTKQAADYVMLNMAVEGDGDNSAEQLAIPVVVTLFSIVPPMLTVFATCFSMSQRTVEVTKYFLCACAVSMMLSVRIFDKLTFDCRWWNNDNSESCKTAFNTFAAGAFFHLPHSHLSPRRDRFPRGEGEVRRVERHLGRRWLQRCATRGVHGYGRHGLSRAEP